MKKRLAILLCMLSASIMLFAEPCSCKEHGKPNNPKNKCCGEEEYDPNWRRGGIFNFSLHSGVINQVNNTLNKIPNINISVNTVSLSETSFKKSICCDGIFKENGISASESNVRMTADIANIPIYKILSVEKKFYLGDGDYINVEFGAGAYLKSNFSLGGMMGKRCDECDAGLNYLYANFNTMAIIAVEATATAKACAYCDFWDCTICLPNFSITPAALSVRMNASADVGNKDRKGVLSAGAFSLSKLVYSASLKIYDYSFSYSYVIID